MTDLFTLENLGHLLMLCFLQAVLGFDNLLYISIESTRAPVDKQKSVRFWGIIIAVVMRVILLFVMVHLIDAMAEPFFVMDWTGIVTGGVNFATLVYIIGGVFIIYTAVKEITHKLTYDASHEHEGGGAKKSAVAVVAMIVTMNLIFSFDSILSALAITKVFPLLATAIIISGLVMLLLADATTRFLQKNRMYEVLGLFILLIVGVVLLGEAGQAAAHAMHDESLALHIFGHEIIPMSKSTFYFSVVVLVVVEIIQSLYDRRLSLNGGGH